MKRAISSLLCIAFCASGLIVAGGPAFTQEKQDTQTESPDLLGDIGRWFDRSITSIGDQFRSAGKGIDQFNHEAGIAAKTTAGAAADAADQVARLPKTRMVSGHQTCPPSENGAPDCAVAAEKLCKANGLSSGTSLAVTSARECPTRAILQREARAECKNVTFVTRAMCQ